AVAGYPFVSFGLSDTADSIFSCGSANALADGLMLCLVSSIISYRLSDSACLARVSFSASAASSRSMSAFTDDRNRRPRPSHSPAARATRGSRSGPITSRATTPITANSQKLISNIAVQYAGSDFVLFPGGDFTVDDVTAALVFELAVVLVG